jgi:hypothetical protein
MPLHRCGACEPTREGLARAHVALDTAARRRAAVNNRRVVAIRRFDIPVVVHCCYEGRTHADATKVVNDLNLYFGRSGRLGDPINSIRRRNLNRVRVALGGNCTQQMARDYVTYVRRAPSMAIRFRLRRTVLKNALTMSLVSTAHLTHSPKLGGWLNNPHVLNIWIVQSNDFLGVATFPWDAASNRAGDGIVIDYRTCFPRFVGTPAYNQGKTAVHEVGHWLGLLHTFTTPNSVTGLPTADVDGGGISLEERQGDMVPDTQQQLTATFGNPFRSRRYPQFRGRLTAFMSYMDYSDDAAMFLFTWQQRARMHTMWRAFRA